MLLPRCFLSGLRGGSEREGIGLPREGQQEYSAAHLANPGSGWLILTCLGTFKSKPAGRLPVRSGDLAPNLSQFSLTSLLPGDWAGWDWIPATVLLSSLLNLGSACLSALLDSEDLSFCRGKERGSTGCFLWSHQPSRSPLPCPGRSWEVPGRFNWPPLFFLVSRCLSFKLLACCLELPSPRATHSALVEGPSRVVLSNRNIR